MNTPNKTLERAARNIRHEANYIDETPIDSKAKRTITSYRLREAAELIDAAIENEAVMLEALQRIIAMENWAGKWAAGEIFTTSHYRLAEAYKIARAAIAKAKGA